MTKSLRDWAGEERRQIALVLTDIISSTSLASLHGDEKWVDNYLIPHFAKARELRDQFNGYEIKLIGDAYMVAFKTADKALEFAEYFLMDTGCEDIFIRMAIHTGRVRVVENDIYGLMANYTARLITSIDQRPRLPDRSMIVVSENALPDIVSTHGQSKMAEFSSFEANLRSFGKHRVWFYMNRKLLRQVRLRRVRLNEKAKKLVSESNASVSRRQPAQSVTPPTGMTRDPEPIRRPTFDLPTFRDPQK